MEGADVFVGRRFIGHPRGEVVEGRTKILIFLADMSELGGDSIELGCDGYDD